MSRNKVILFDADSMTGKKTGIGYYTSSLIESIAEVADENTYFIGHYFDFLGKDSIKNLPQGPNIAYKASKLIPRKIYNLLRRLGINIPIELLLRSRGDFIIFPNYLRKKSFFNTPYLTVVHDLTYLEKPEYVEKKNLQDLKKLMPDTLRHASLIFTISSATKQAILKHYRNLTTPIYVEHIPPTLNQTPTLTDNYRDSEYIPINRKYILFIGTFEPRKNINGLLEAYKNNPYLHENYSLILVGGYGWSNTNIIDKISNLKKEGFNLITTGYVGDLEKQRLYRGASLVVVPSFYEGYGLQLVEAAYFNTPLAVSDIPVFREVIGDGAVYFNPKDSIDIGKVLCEILIDKKMVAQITKNQKRVIKRLDWKMVAHSFYRKINKVI